MKAYIMKAILVAVVVAVSLPAFAAMRTVRTTGGMPVPGIGLEIDASYDPRLDTLAEGYKIVNAVIANGSFNIIYLDPNKDKWTVKTADGADVKGIVNLRKEAPKVWARIPEKARELMGYPLALPIGSKQNVDIFVPASVDLSNLNEISVFVKSLNIRMDVAVGP